MKNINLDEQSTRQYKIKCDVKDVLKLFENSHE